MLNRSTQYTQKDRHSNKSAQSTLFSEQYGIDCNISHQKGRHQHFLGIPTESLSHITSFLDPPCLLVLARVCKLLYAHVKDDNTWHRAFLRHFFGVSPERDLYDSKVQAWTRLLRRLSSTWRVEFITRYNLGRCWERSRNTAITHLPTQSPISDIYLMRSHQPPALLTSSLQYGIVSRSFPLTGKVLRGYLDASGTGLGVGNNNPNLEFTPNVTACAMANEGGTARIIWGFRDGQVAVMTAPKAMAMDGGGRAGAHAAKLVRCQAREDHEGAVLDAAWDTHTSAAALITGGADARIKLWDAKSVRCIWTSTRHDLVPDPIVKVAFRRDGIAVGAARSGDIAIYTGLSVFLSPEESPKLVPLETRVPCPLRTASTSAGHALSHEILALHLTPLGCSPAVLAMYKSEDHFYRISLTSSSGYQLTRFGDACVPITAVMTSFSRPGYEGTEGNVIYTGDQLGSVALYDWDTPHTDSPISPMHKFFAHALPITALAQSPDAVVLVIGSADGGVKVFDALSFDPLRAFAFSTKTFRTVPIDDETEGLSVERIIVENDTLVAFAGARVLAWKSGGTHTHGHLRHGGKRIRKTPGRAKPDRGAAKYRQRLEIKQEMAELRPELEREQASIRRTLGRENEHWHELDKLGLDESEALAYVLMLSREEEETRRAAAAEEGVFEGDFDGPSSPPLWRRGQSYEEGLAASMSLSSSLSTSSSMLSETSLAESLQGGVMTDRSSLTIESPTAADQAREFPLISPVASISSMTSLPGRAGHSPSPPHTTRGVVGSTSWSSVVSRVASSGSINRANTGVSVRRRGAEEAEEEQLKIAIALSLAEARSREEDV